MTKPKKIILVIILIIYLLLILFVVNIFSTYYPFHILGWAIFLIFYYPARPEKKFVVTLLLIVSIIVVVWPKEGSRYTDLCTYQCRCLGKEVITGERVEVLDILPTKCYGVPVCVQGCHDVTVIGPEL